MRAQSKSQRLVQNLASLADQYKAQKENNSIPQVVQEKINKFKANLSLMDSNGESYLSNNIISNVLPTPSPK